MESAPMEASQVSTVRAFFTTVASVTATAVLARSVIGDLMPGELKDQLSFQISSLCSRFSFQTTMVIEEFDGLVANQIYEAAETYIGQKVSAATARRLRVSKPESHTGISVAVERDQTVTDVFHGVDLKWTLVCRQAPPRRSGFYNPRDMNSTLRAEVRSFELAFHKKHLDFVLASYLPHVVAQSNLLKQERRTLQIFTVDGEEIYSISDAWIPTNLDHPATFDTVALDAEVKKFVIEDLDRFLRRRDYYRKVGKAWKRGYLLYGPPGTGKSSLIAAMANYLRFDVYDLELTELKANSDLKKLLIAMANKSILVIEDIDCSVNFEDRTKSTDSDSDTPTPKVNKLTLSGLLNFIDGLWSSCGDERIIVFTTNHKEKLDPALLRPGRMDVHIHLSYCTPYGFRTLASNYLGLEKHDLFEEIEQRLESTEATPAEVAEELIKSDNPDIALQGLIDFLRAREKEIEEAKLNKEREGDEKPVEEEEIPVAIVGDDDEPVETEPESV